MTSFASSVLTNLQISLDVASTMRAIGEGKGRQLLFRERAPDALPADRIEIASIFTHGAKAPRKAILGLNARSFK